MTQSTLEINFYISSLAIFAGDIATNDIESSQGATMTMAATAIRIAGSLLLGARFSWLGC